MNELPAVEIEGREYFWGYKVVTEELRSLGLRRNPTILQYPIGSWYFLPEEAVIEGSSDFGGIWVCRSRSGAKTLTKYMMDQYSLNTRVFTAAVDRILFENSYRVKTNGILLLEEICLQ